jgi:hypothetical protein
VAAHFAGVGDESLLEEASRSPEVRRLLADVASAEAGLASEPVSASLRSRALAAWDAPVAARAVPLADADAPRALRPVARWPAAARAAAAVLVVATPLAVFTLPGGPVEAAPSLAVDGIERLDLSGGVAAEGVRALEVGRRIAPGPTEIVSLRLAGGSRVVLGGGDDLRVACDGSACRAAALALESGEIVLSAAAASPVSLLLRGGGRVDLLPGDANVAEGASHATLALRAGARASWTPPGAARPVSLVGPATVSLDGVAGDAGAAARAPSDALFRDLAFFGGRLNEAPTERVASAGQWRILRPAAGAASGPAVRASDAAGVPAIRMDLAPGGAARLAWRPEPGALAAGRIEALPRWRVRPAAAAAGAGAPRLFVSVEGAPDRVAVPAPSRADDGVRVSLALPASLRDGGEAVLSFSVEGAPAVAWFEGTAYGSPPPPLRAPEPPSDESREARR